MISRSVVLAMKNNQRPVLTDLILCKKGNILMNSKDLVRHCELENCCTCKVEIGANATLEEMV